MGTAAAIELNDAEIGIADASGVLALEPGFALLDAHETLVGTPARRASRLRPRDIHTRFWSDLSLDPLPRATRSAATSADLAFAQLSSLWERFGSGVEEVALSVPPQLAREKLGLVLGIAQEIGIPVCGMVETPVAASRRPHPRAQLVHLDAGLHETILTLLAQEQGGEGRVSKAGVEVLSGAGLLAFEERWLRTIAAAFLSQTRFDPLHQGATEQLLCDQLPGWLESLASATRVDCSLSFRGHTHTAGVGRSELADSAQDLYTELGGLLERVREPSLPLVIQVSHRLANVPGLLERLRAAPGARVVELPRAASLLAAVERIDAIRSPGDGVVLSVRLPWAERPEPEPEPKGASSEPVRAVSHVVCDGLARPVETSAALAEHCTLERRDAQWQIEPRAGASVRLNGAPLQGPVRLAPGDRLEVGDALLLVVAVVSGDGA